MEMKKPGQLHSQNRVNGRQLHVDPQAAGYRMLIDAVLLGVASNPESTGGAVAIAPKFRVNDTAETRSESIGCIDG